MVPPKIMNTDTPNTSKNSRALGLLREGRKPRFEGAGHLHYADKAAQAQDEHHDVDAVDDAPHTMEYGMSAMDTGCEVEPS